MRLLNILVYLAALITITLLVLRESISGWDILDKWPIAGFSLFNKSMLFSYLGMTGYKQFNILKSSLLWSLLNYYGILPDYSYDRNIFLFYNRDDIYSFRWGFGFWEKDTVRGM